MAFLKYAHSALVKPDITFSAWDEVCASAQVLGSAFSTREASRVSLEKFNPSDYMLTHNTIVASVDTEDGPGKLGRSIEGGSAIDRRWSDYYITPETTPWINSNNDSWERKLLLSSFRTFVGGENYVEHLQIPEMSKGKIIDAAARDIGGSVYIDILVATHRKFKPLVASIQSGQLSTLSMGCSVVHTTCSQCGNVAHDETQLCPHIRFMKGNTFIDALGKTRKTAELCGHLTDEPGSCRFIEASWVANPAFKGAVLRNILTEQEASAYATLHKDKVAVAFSTPAYKPEGHAMPKAARVEPSKVAFDFGDEGDGDDSDAPKEESNPLETAISEMADYIRSKAVRQVKDELSPKKTVPHDLNESENDTLIKEASRHTPWKRIAKMLLGALDDDATKARRLLLGLILHKKGGWGAVRTSGEFNGPEMLVLSRILDKFSQLPEIAGESKIYRTVLAVGGAAQYADEDLFLTACRRVLGRKPTETETQALVHKAKIFDLGQ